jgi:hypothetical protein
MKYLKIKAKSFLAIILSITLTLTIFFSHQTGNAQSSPPRFLSDADESAVLAWIGNETAAEKAPYCYRQSYGRGVGTVPTEAGTNRVKIGALSYSQCPANTKRVGVDCHSVCPDGMRDDGLFCRTSEYGRGAGYVSRSICNRNAPKFGTSECDKIGLLFYPRCRPGYSAFGTNICRPNPPNCNALGLGGRIDLSCAKKVIVGDAKPFICSSGKENDAGLCYNGCRQGYGGIGPVCWQNCNPGTFSCGAGCTKDKSNCINNTISQVTTPISLAINIISFGSASSATSAATGSASKVSTLFKSAKDALQPLVPYLKDANEVRKLATVAVNETKAFSDALNRFTDAYVANLEEMTTSNVVKTLKERFNQEQYNFIAKQYGLLQFQVAADQLNIDLLKGLTPLDPTGISGVIAAYAKPICTKNQPFPNITILK